MAILTASELQQDIIVLGTAIAPPLDLPGSMEGFAHASSPLHRDGASTLQGTSGPQDRIYDSLFLSQSGVVDRGVCPVADGRRTEPASLGWLLGLAAMLGLPPMRDGFPQTQVVGKLRMMRYERSAARRRFENQQEYGNASEWNGQVVQQ